MKMHFYDPKTLRAAPYHVKEQYETQGLNGTACGFVRWVFPFRKQPPNLKGYL